MSGITVEPSKPIQLANAINMLAEDKNLREAYGRNAFRRVCNIFDAEKVLDDSLEIYLKAKIRSIMLSSKCSEQSARMTAMDSATTNADDILAELNLKYNRIRQTMITQEISEIVGGASAQK